MSLPFTAIYLFFPYIEPQTPKPQTPKSQIMAASQLKVCQSLLYTLLCLQIVLISGIFFLSMNHSTLGSTSQVNSTPSLLALLLKLSTAPVCLLGIILVLAQATSLLTFLYLPLRLGFLFLLAKVYTLAATPGHFNAFQLVLLVESFTQALLLRYVMVLYKGGEGEGEGVQEQQQQQCTKSPTENQKVDTVVDFTLVDRPPSYQEVVVSVNQNRRQFPGSAATAAATAVATKTLSAV